MLERRLVKGIGSKNPINIDPHSFTYGLRTAFIHKWSIFMRKVFTEEQNFSTVANKCIAAHLRFKGDPLSLPLHKIKKATLGGMK